MAIEDIMRCFDRSSILQDLQLRLSIAQKEHAPDLILQNIAKMQSVFEIKELNWERKICYIEPKKSRYVQSSIKSMVKSLLIEHYGQRAVHLQIVVVPSQRESAGK